MSELSLLVVDDLSADRLLIRSVLQRIEQERPGQYKFFVREADTLTNALAAIAEQQPDIVLLDLMLPDSRGTDTAVRIREATSAPIVVLTAYTEEQLAGSTLAAGAHEYVLKSELRPYLLERAMRYAFERRHFETALKESHSRLLQAKKMEAVAQLAGGIAHDFNNLLTIIAGNAAILRADGKARNDEIDAILTAADRATRLTRQLLTFASRQVTQPALLDLNDVVRSAATEMRQHLPAMVELRMELNPAPVMLYIDRVQLEQVLLNLVDNALEAMPSGGTLRIDTTVTDGNGVLTVSDTGVGIGEDVLDQIFQPYFSTRPRPEARGLGLAVVYGIVQQSGGSIAVDSEVGTGSSVRVSFPIQAKSSSAALPQQPRMEHGVPTILLVDDEAGVRDLIATVLRRRGYNVLTASDGSNALSVVEAQAQSINLIITDVVMPVMGGREFAERARALLPNVPTLFISGYHEDSIFREGLLPPGTRMLQKPFILDELVQVVEELLQEKR